LIVKTRSGWDRYYFVVASVLVGLEMESDVVIAGSRYCGLDVYVTSVSQVYDANVHIRRSAHPSNKKFGIK
jgi:hypothetical protein